MVLSANQKDRERGRRELQRKTRKREREEVGTARPFEEVGRWNRVRRDLSSLLLLTLLEKVKSYSRT